MMLAYPKMLDVTPIVANITQGIDDDGSPKIVATYVGKCRYVEKTRSTRDADGNIIQLVGKAYIGCDIAPSVSLLEGHVTIENKTMKIYIGSRPRSSDGIVHHTALELM